jgi:CBS domain containing-hemolysin-like protein
MIEFALVVLLLLGNAFFVGSEFAIIASRRAAIQPMAATSRRARWALRAVTDIPQMIAGAQLGITICSLGLGAIAEPAFAHLIETPFHAIGLPESALHPVAFTLALGVVVFLHTGVGEMVPKNLTLADPRSAVGGTGSNDPTLTGPEVAVLWLGAPMLAFCVATRPLLVALKWISASILRIWGIEATDAVKTVYTAAELANLVTYARSEGWLEPEEHARIEGALALRTRTAAEAMRPWSEVTTVPEEVTPEELEALAARTGRSRFPVVHQDGRPVTGFVHVKDVIGLRERGDPIPGRLIRPLDPVGQRRVLGELLIDMRNDRRHIVLVGDAQTPMGVLTLHDVIGVLVPDAKKAPLPTKSP